jgi:DNA repair exonuclease SbcCD ATPase subunit
MATTDIAKPLGSGAVGESTNELPLDGTLSRQNESGDSEISANQLSTLLRRALETPTREIDNLIAEFEVLRKRLQTDANRIERDIVEYAELSQHVMQLTTIISETVKKIPRTTDVEKY